jgi:hypothetical protein
LTNPPPPGWGQPSPPGNYLPPPYGGYSEPAPLGGYPPAPGGYPAPPPYGAYPTSPGTNGLAIGSLVCSLASPLLCSVLAIVGIVLGIVALNQIKQTGQGGRGLALAGIIVGAAFIVIAIVAVVVYVVWFSANVGSMH